MTDRPRSGKLSQRPTAADREASYGRLRDEADASAEAVAKLPRKLKARPDLVAGRVSVDLDALLALLGIDEDDDA